MLAGSPQLRGAPLPHNYLSTMVTYIAQASSIITNWLRETFPHDCIAADRQGLSHVIDQAVCPVSTFL